MIWNLQHKPNYLKSSCMNPLFELSLTTFIQISIQFVIYRKNVRVEDGRSDERTALISA